MLSCGGMRIPRHFEQALVELGSGVASQSEVPLAHLVGWLARREFTGVLSLELDGRGHTVYLQNGDIVDADPASSEDALGRVALDAGLVDIHAVHESLQRLAHDRRRSQKDILVEMGALGGDALEHALRMTLTRRAVRIFALLGATIRVDKIVHGRLEGGPVEPRWIVHRGVRTYYDEGRLDLELASLAGHAIRLAVDPAEISAAFGFSHGELVVVRYLAKRHHWELGDLVDYCETVPRATVLAVVHTLHAFEELDVQPRDAVSRYRRMVREPTVQVPPVLAETPPPAAIPGPAGGPAGTRPPLGAPPRRPAASQPLSPATSGVVEDESTLSANQHFMKGELALRREKYAEAIEEFRAAVELDESSPEYHAFLAWSKWCHATSKDAVFPEVKIGLLKASKLSGNRCVPAFYFRGLIHDARGEQEKAYRSFQIVCSLDEGHIDAARMMHLIERRQQSGSKGLFDRLRRK
jgi:tetratricopeptide (TPR) repeat protein